MQIQMPFADLYSKLFKSILTLVLILITGLDGLRDVRLEGPRYVRQGEDVILRCNYKLDNDSLYVVKWYRGSEEFYRFVPKEVPPKRFFDYPGLSFNEKYCNDHEIFLKNVVLETTGKFKCAVSAESTFQTFVASQDLTVVAIEYSGPPRVEVEQSSYYPGETAKANCSLGKVSHSLNFTWYINGIKVPKEMSKSFTSADPEEPSLTRSMSIFQFEISPSKSNWSSSSKGGPGPGVNNNNGVEDTRLKCQAELFDLYKELSSEIVIQHQQPRYSLSNQDTLRRSSAAINTNTGGEGRHGRKGNSWRNLIPLLALVMGLGEVVSLVVTPTAIISWTWS